MNFLVPAAFWLALLLPVLILFYLLKLRRDERVVSSTYVWQRFTRDVEANVPWQRLRRNWLLVLQLAFLIILILAIARPYLHTKGIPSQTAVLIIDTSSSMAATDIAPNRLEAAKTTAHQIVDDLPSGARLTIITAGEKPRTLLSLSSDVRLIHQTVNQIQISTGGSDMGIALQIANAIASRQPDVQTIVISDGNVTLPTRSSMKGNFIYIPIGSETENQAIQLLSLKIDPSDQSISAFTQIGNYGAKTATRRLALYVDRALFKVYDLMIPSQGEESILATGILSTTQIVEARLLPSEITADYLALDDSAFAAVLTPKPRKVFLVGDGDLFLENALGLIPHLEVLKVEPTDILEEKADLVIFNQSSPVSSELPKSNLLFIHPIESTSLFSITGRVDLPLPAPTDPQDSLIEHVDFEGVNILDATQIRLPSWSKAIVIDGSNLSSDPTPLLFAGEMDGRRIAVLSFDPRRSDLPLQVAFPILVSNLIRWLAPGLATQTPGEVHPGQAILIQNPGISSSDVNSVQITRPDGVLSEYEFQDGQVIFSDTTQLGIYRIDMGEKDSAFFAVNLFSPQESSLLPQKTLQIAGINPDGAAALTDKSPREYWRPVALLALAILFLEWLLYQRATLVMVWQQAIGAINRNRLSKQ